MKYLLCICLFIGLSLSLLAQNSYQEAIQQGDLALKNGQYKVALNKYFSAIAFEPARRNYIQTQKIEKVFDEIQQQKRDLQIAKDNLDTALVKAEKARKIAVSNQLAAVSSNALYVDKNNSDALHIAKAAWDTVFTPAASLALSSAYENMINDGYLYKTNINRGFSRTKFSPQKRYIVNHYSHSVEIFDLTGNSIIHFKNHSGRILSYDFSSDEELVLTTCTDTSKLWDLQGNIILNIEHTTKFPMVTFSPNKKIILSVTNSHELEIWSLEGKLINNINLDARIDWIPSFSYDSKYILVPFENKPSKVFDLRGNEILEFEQNASSGVFSPTTNTILQISFEEFIQSRVFDLNKNIIISFNPHKSIFGNIFFSPKGNYILEKIDSDSIIQLWNLKKELIFSLKCNETIRSNVIFSPKENIVSIICADDWNNSSELIINTINKDTIAQFNLKSNATKTIFSPNNKYILSFHDKTPVVMNNVGEKLLYLDTSFIEHFSSINYACFSPDSKFILTCSKDNTAKIWDLNGVLQSNLIHFSSVEYAEFSKDNKSVLTNTSSDQATLWYLPIEISIKKKRYNSKIKDNIFLLNWDNISSNTLQTINEVWHNKDKFQDIYDGTKEIQISPKINRVITYIGYSRDTIYPYKLWDMNGNFINSLEHPVFENNFKNENSSFKIYSGFSEFFSNNIMTYSLWNGNTMVSLWDLDGDVFANLSHDTTRIDDYHISPNEQLIITQGSTDNVVKLWNKQGKLKSTLMHSPYELYNAYFTAESDYILTLSHKGKSTVLYLWELNGNKKDSLFINGKIFSDDLLKTNENYILFSSNSTATLWDIENSETQIFREHNSTINLIKFTPNKNKILTCSDDGICKIWNYNGDVIDSFITHKSSIEKVYFLKRSSNIITISEDASAKLWSSKGKLLADFDNLGSDISIFIPKSEKYIVIQSENENSVVSLNLYDLKGNSLEKLLNRSFHSFSKDENYLLTITEDFYQIIPTPQTIYDYLNQDPPPLPPLTNEELKKYGIK